MGITTNLLTAEQFAQLETAEDEHFELIEGELIPLSSPTPLHARICGRLDRRVSDYFGRHPGGEAFREMDCALSSNTVRRPDVAIFLAARAPLIDLKKIPVPFPPDIAVEVISPSELAIQVHRKALDYLRAGTQEVWLLDPENGEIFVQKDSGIRLLRGSEVLDSTLLPGFYVSVAELLN